MALVASSLVPMDRLGRLWPHAEPVEHTLGRLGARSARAARGGEMSRIIRRDDRTFDVDVACGPVRTLHVKDRVSLVVFTTVAPRSFLITPSVGPTYSTRHIGHKARFSLQTTLRTSGNIFHA